MPSRVKQSAHSCREICWSLSMSQARAKLFEQRFGFTNFLTSFRRSRYSVLSSLPSRFLSISLNFHSRTTRSKAAPWRPSSLLIRVHSVWKLSMRLLLKRALSDRLQLRFCPRPRVDERRLVVDLPVHVQIYVCYTCYYMYHVCCVSTHHVGHIAVC